ncbi:MAG TPA: zf-HC2 domain-containing protein [Lysobacter sp.]
MKILRFEGSAHSETQRLLPWYVNDTLDAADFSRVEEHLAECGQCRRDLEFLRLLESGCMQASPVPDPTASFTRLRDRLQPPRAHASASLLTRLRATWGGSPAWLRGAAAASLVLAAGVWGLALVRDEAPAMYRTLGDAPSETAVRDKDLRHLVVVFDPHIEHARMQQLVRASQARIVDGPNEAGAYVLAVPADREASVRDALRAASGVTLVETLDADGQRR